MARPKKNNADYFSHDADMRNDAKIKAIRRKFGVEGYGVYLMLLEILTDKDYFRLEWNDLNVELISADIEIEAKLLIDIVDYLVNILKMFTIEDNFLYCKKLILRFDSLLSKRKRDINTKTSELSTTKTPNKIVIDDENPQSKVKESRVKESKLNKQKEFELFWLKYPKKVGKKDCFKKWLSLSKKDTDKILITIDGFIKYKPFKDYNHPNPKTYLNGERWNDEKVVVKKVSNQKIVF